MIEAKQFAEAASVDVAAVQKDLYGPLRAWYALIVFEIQSLAQGIDMAIVTLLVRPIETSLHINDVGFATITATSFAIGFAILQYPAGVLTDILRRRDVISIGSAIWVIAALVSARTNSPAMFFLARLLAAIGIGITNPAIYSMLGDAFPRTRRAFSISVFMAGLSIGGGIGLTTCGALVAAAQRNGTIHFSGMLISPWQQCFVAVAVIGVLALAFVLTIPEAPRMERLSRASSNLRSTLGALGQYFRRHWFLWSVLIIGNSVGQMNSYAIGTWGPAFGMRHYGITGVSSIALLGAYGAGGSLLGSIVGGILAQRGINHGDPRILPRLFVAVSLISCVFGIAFPYMPSWALAAAGMGAVSATFMALSVLLTVGVQETAPNEVRGQLYSLWNIIGVIPMAAGPTLVAVLASGIFAKTGDLVPALAVIGGVTSVLATILFALSGRPYERAMHEMRALVASSQTGDTYIHDC